jgi:hypothetical protein
MIRITSRLEIMEKLLWNYEINIFLKNYYCFNKIFFLDINKFFCLFKNYDVIQKLSTKINLK